MIYIPKHLSRWTRPDSYMGASWPEMYVFLGQTRDSDCLTRSNFICALQALGGESETVQVIRESHWAVGWVEWIGIHCLDKKALQAADKIQADLEDYPVVNEDHWSELESDEAYEYWQSMSVSERVEICQQCEANIFAARHDYPPYGDSDPNGMVEQYLRES